jgi:uncharacterized protein (DUF2235 family)
MPDTSIAVTPPARKRIALFLDGTWNTLSDNTNVWRLKSLCAPISVDKSKQVIYYNAGLGTRSGQKVRGGAFGYGIDEIVLDAYEWLVENYNPNDEIFIFGFSRGAFTARSLSGLVSRFGLLTPGSPLSIRQLYDRYRKGNQVLTIHQLSTDQKKVHPTVLEEEWLLKYSLEISIKFIGVWDTVGALGKPSVHTSWLSGGSHEFLDTNLRTSNEFAFHAVAIDEHREAFLPTLWTKYVPKDPKTSTPPWRDLSQVEQRWFVGAHANVGGGYDNDLLAQVPLKWMMRKAAACGLSFRRDIDIEGNVHQSPVVDSFGPFMYGAYKLLKFGQPYYREIARAPEERKITVVHTINETIDPSVFERWRLDEKYRPQNLRNWAERHKLKVEEIHSAVRADNPQEQVPDDTAYIP